MILKNKGYISVLITLFVFFIVIWTFMPKYLFHKGKSLLDNKDFISASEYLHKALIFKPDNVDYRYYYVKALSEMKPTYSIQKNMYEFAHSNKDDGAKILANEKIIEWKRNINENIGNNYIDQAPSDSNILRWNKNSFPLAIYIDYNSLKGLPDYYTSAINRALMQWEKSIDFVSFTKAKNKNDAKILISFERLPDNVCTEKVCKYVAGFTNPKISGRTLKVMKITIYDKNPKGDYFSDKEIYNTVLHELGHALGIMGHSYSTDDLMYQQNKDMNSIYAKFRSDFHYLSGNDVNTLRLLYMLEPTITDKKADSGEGLIYTPIILGSQEDIASKKVKEALDYIKTSPEISVGYINLAGAYADLKEYNKAISALNNALDNASSDNEKFIIYYNFAYVYMNIEKYDTALQYAELAKSIQTTQDIMELIGVIKHNKSIKK